MAKPKSNTFKVGQYIVNLRKSFMMSGREGTGYRIGYRQAGILAKRFGYKLPGVGKELILANVEGKISGPRYTDKEYTWTYTIKLVHNGDSTYMLVDPINYLMQNNYIILD